MNVFLRASCIPSEAGYKSKWQTTLQGTDHAALIACPSRSPPIHPELDDDELSNTDPECFGGYPLTIALADCLAVSMPDVLLSLCRRAGGDVFSATLR